MKTICGLALAAVVVGCHLDKLLGGSGGGSPPPSHGTPVGLSFTTQPRTVVQAGQPIGPVRVSIVDSAGQPVAGVDTTTVFVALGTNPGGATLHGDTSTHPVNGVATFASLSLDNAGHGYTLTARAAGLTQPSAPFDIVAPPPTTGTLTVTTNTPANPPTSGYTVAVSGGGGTTKPIGASATVTFLGLSAGNHTVTLRDVPSTCTVAGGNSQTAAITAGDTAAATFTIACTPPPPTTGTIAVTTATSGPSQPTGYTVTLDASASKSIPASGSVSFTDVPAGNHSVVLSGAPANCTVGGGTSRTVTITAGQTTPATFTVTCVAPPPTTGDLTVTTTTSGSDLDPDGYTVTVDGTDRAIPTNSSGITFSGLAAGPHTVGLSSVASNCSVSGSNPRNADVPAGGVGRADFTISCTALPPPQNHAPVVNAGGDQTILLALGSVTINPSFTDQDGDGPWAYTIDWGDGSSSNGTRLSQGGFSASHSYGLVSTNTVTVTVTDSHGLSGSDQAKITVVLFLTPRP